MVQKTILSVIQPLKISKMVIRFITLTEIFRTFIMVLDLLDYKILILPAFGGMNMWFRTDGDIHG